MLIALSLVRDSFDSWVVVTLAVLVLWVWQKRVRKAGPSVLSIQQDDAQLKKQKMFIQKTDRLRKYALCFATASAVLGIATIVAWFHRIMR